MSNTLDEIVLGIIERTESYRQNNDMSILESGDLTKWFIPEEVEKLKALRTEARIDEWDLLGETLHSAGIASELHINNVRESRLAQLKEKL